MHKNFTEYLDATVQNNSKIKKKRHKIFLIDIFYVRAIVGKINKNFFLLSAYFIRIIYMLNSTSRYSKTYILYTCI